MRTATRLLPLLFLVAACALGGDEDAPTAESALSGTASISLSNSSARVTHTSDSTWTLDKTGSLSGNTVTWNINATKTATVSGQLVIQGQMTVTNTGSGPATIGNIVVALQTKAGNKWVTRSADVANATQGDAATTAKIHAAASSENKSTFTENAASGELQFMDATNNTVFSLVPQKLIGPGQTVSLLFQASFNNNVLNLATGTAIRAEVIVSFGNATQSGNSTPNVDINGNGTIDADEARIRSVPTRLTLAVPTQVPGNKTVTLTDTVDDIIPTGTVTFSNVVINLGATSGTVTATVSGGTSGGTITNCAHLTSPTQTVTSGGFTFPMIDGIDITDCAAVQVGPTQTCTHGTPGCGWTQGDALTLDHNAWSTSSLLLTTFTQAYPAGLVVGGTHTITFNQIDRLQLFLGAQVLSPGVLSESLLNPDSSSAGVFAAQVIALQVNVDYAEANRLSGSFDLGDLYICGTPFTSVNGMTVSQFLASANLLLGGDLSQPFSPTVGSAIASSLNVAFAGGTPSSFAQANLFSTACTN